MLHLLSGGGSIYAANVQEKLARAYIQHGSPNGVTRADVKEAVWALKSTVPVVAEEGATDEATGLSPQ